MARNLKKDYFVEINCGFDTDYVHYDTFTDAFIGIGKFIATHGKEYSIALLESSGIRHWAGYERIKAKMYKDYEKKTQIKEYTVIAVWHGWDGKPCHFVENGVKYHRCYNRNKYTGGWDEHFCLVD